MLILINKNVGSAARKYIFFGVSPLFGVSPTRPWILICRGLLVFIKSLVLKLCQIVCSETRNLVHPEFFNITRYKIYYNINQNDGLVVYKSVYITETTEIIDINNLKIILKLR